MSLTHLVLKDHERIKKVNQTEIPSPSRRTQPNSMTYTAGAIMPLTSSLHIVTPQEDAPHGTWPAFRMMVCVYRKMTMKTNVYFRCSSEE